MTKPGMLLLEIVRLSRSILFQTEMPKAYVSSTVKDLREHRLVAINTLDRLGYTTRAMEKYFASDERPLEMCLADLAQCDLYVGIFAWRYGTIPYAQNAERHSITECEFREALRLRIPCLIFLSDEDLARWPHGDDADLARVTSLRTELAGERNIGFFKTPDQLGLEISVAVSRWEINPDFRQYLVALIAECFELPELPGRTRNLSLDQINEIFVTLPAAAGDSKDDPAACTIDLAQALTRERNLLLVGEPGQGKTTALRFLAHHAASLWLAEDLNNAGGEEVKALIPIHVSLRRDRSIRAQLWSAVQRQTFRCSRELLDQWLRNRPFLLLLDGIENVDAQSVLDDADEIVRLGVSTRCIVASRPQTVPVRCAWPQARIQPLSDSSLRALLLRLLGSDRGEDLFNKLAQNKVLEPFRRPLFARLLALRSQESSDPRRFTPAAVFRDVLESRFLTDWEQTKSQARPMVRRDFLAYLAHEMVERNVYLIDRETAFAAACRPMEKRGISIANQMVETLLDDALFHGLLVESDGGVQFWHSSFRDYFAGIWLEKQRSAVAVYIRTWKREWHEGLVFYYGMLSDDRLSRELWRLLIGFHAISIWLHFGPSGAMSDRLLLVVRCLAQAGDAAPRQQRYALRRLPRSFQSWFLSGSASPVAYSRFADAFDPYRYLCDLLGQMGVREAFAYLRRIDTELGVVAFGLMRDPDPSAINDLVEQLMETVANDRIASTERATDTYLVSNLLLKSRDPRCLAALQGAVKAAGNNHRRSRILLRLCYTLEHYPCVPEERVVLEEQWAPLLIEYALCDENDEVRDAAVSFLHALDRDPAGHRSLPKQAHDTFLHALGDPSPVIRARALEAMRFPALHHHMDIVWKLLDEDNFAMVFGALFHLRLCGKDSLFFRAVLKVLRRFARKETVLHSRANEILAGLRIDHAGPRSRLRSIALLMSGAERDSYKPGSGEGLALYAVLTLGRMRIDWIAPFLARVLRQEGWDRTRSAALDALVDLLGADAQAFVLEALSDRSSRIRDHATWICWTGTFGRDFPARSGPLLFRLIGDESQETSHNARLALKKIGLISDDWHPFQGPPTYLGPAAENAATAR